MFYIIANPRAERVRKILDPITQKLKEAGLDYDIFAGEDKEEITKKIRTLSENGAEDFIAVGGDGTVNDVISSVVDPARLRLGIVPVGTGNDFAAAAKIPEGLAALDYIVGCEPKPTDYIQFEEGFRSINIAGVGIDVDILERSYRMKRGGKSKYFRSLLSSLAHYKGQRIEVTVDGQCFTKTALIAAICNGSQLGGGIRICPPAVIDDGKLNLFVADCPRRIRIPFELMRLMQGKIIGRPIVTHLLCEKVRIVQIEGKSAEFDGEIAECRVLTAEAVHGKLKVYRP